MTAAMSFIRGTDPRYVGCLYQATTMMLGYKYPNKPTINQIFRESIDIPVDTFLVYLDTHLDHSSDHFLVLLPTGPEKLWVPWEIPFVHDDKFLKVIE